MSNECIIGGRTNDRARGSLLKSGDILLLTERNQGRISWTNAHAAKMVKYLQMVGNGPVDICKMCLNVKQLQDSHLLPASVYKKLRRVHLSDADNPNPDPIAVTFRKARQTSKQTTDYLLCSDCEGILDRMGEKHVLPLLATEVGFPLYDLLKRIPPEIEEPDLVIYSCAKMPSLDCEKLAHFATGIFWKTAIHAWRSGASTVKIDLQGHEENLREYLLGAKPFPDEVALILRIAPPNLPLLSAVTPITVRNANFDMHWFYVPGITFSLHVGKQAALEFREGCFVHNPGRPVFVDPTAALILGKLYRESFMTAEKSTRLAAALEKRRKRHINSSDAPP
jgi:hypothetical protein